MKLFFALILCGFACAWSTSICDDSESNKCIRTQGRENDKYPETAEDLDDLCSPLLEELDCTLEFTDRCPNTLTGAFRDSIEEYRVVYGKICDHGDTLRQKYLSKISCLKENLDDGVEKECTQTVTVQEYCEREPELHECSKSRVGEICGQDGKEVFEELFGPIYTMKKVFCM